MPGALKAKVGGSWVLASSAAGGGGAEEVYIGPIDPGAGYDLWIDTSIAADAPPTSWSGWTWPANQALTQSSFTGLVPSGEAGNSADFVALNLARPAGWAGPDPLRVLRLIYPGRYMVSGALSLSASVASESGFTFINFCQADGTAVTEGTHLHSGSQYGPFMYNTYANFSTTFQTLVPDVCVRFGVFLNVAGISTWSAPGRMSIWRTG